MSRSKFAAIAATYALLTFSSVLNAAELKLLRYGPLGEEKPGLVDTQGRIHDLSAHIDDIGPATLSDAALEEIAQIPLSELPLVQGNPRIGVPVTRYRQDRCHRIQLRQSRGGDGGRATYRASGFHEGHLRPNRPLRQRDSTSQRQ